MFVYKTFNLKKYILIPILIVVLVVASISLNYKLKNTNVDIESADAISITSDNLYNEYDKDSTVSKLKYLDKILLVKGIVNSVSINQLNQKVVQLKTSVDGAFVNCTFDKVSEDSNIHSGDYLQLKGICKGIGESDKDLGIIGDVYLIRCYPEKQEK